MNLDYFFQRIIGRPTCTLAKNAKLYRTAKIRNAFGKNENIRIGDNSLILGELLTFAHGGQINIGEWCYVGEGSRIWSAIRISIGDRVLISHNVNVYDNLTHPIAAGARHQQFREIATSGHPKIANLDEKEITICSDVLIGTSSIILRGVTLGSGAIIGAGSVVVQDVPPYVIVAGNPARIIRELRQDER